MKSEGGRKDERERGYQTRSCETEEDIGKRKEGVEKRTECVITENGYHEKEGEENQGKCKEENTCAPDWSSSVLASRSLALSAYNCCNSSSPVFMSEDSKSAAEVSPSAISSL